MEKVHQQWNFQLLAMVYFVTLIASLMLLPCLCGIGSQKSGATIIIFTVIGLRILLAKKRKERNNDWKVYMAFILISPICIEFLLGH